MFNNNKYLKKKYVIYETYNTIFKIKFYTKY
jgi:hypothetical protein